MDRLPIIVDPWHVQHALGFRLLPLFNAPWNLDHAWTTLGCRCVSFSWMELQEMFRLVQLSSWLPRKLMKRRRRIIKNNLWYRDVLPNVDWVLYKIFKFQNSVNLARSRKKFHSRRWIWKAWLWWKRFKFLTAEAAKPNSNNRIIVAVKTWWKIVNAARLSYKQSRRELITLSLLTPDKNCFRFGDYSLKIRDSHSWYDLPPWNPFGDKTAEQKLVVLLVVKSPEWAHRCAQGNNV